jgi:hypothetical protein
MAAVPSVSWQRGAVRCASVQGKKMIRERGGLGGLHGPVGLLFFLFLFFLSRNSFFFSCSIL